MNAFETLELRPGASPEEIRSAYHRLAKAWHPDGFTGCARAGAEVRFRQLAQAFNDLMGAAQTEPSAGHSEPCVRTPEQGFQEAREALEEGEKERALCLIQAALREDPRKPEYHVLHAKLLVANASDLRPAIKALETALGLQPDHADAMIKLAGLYRIIGMPTRASVLLKRAQELAPNHRHFRSKACRASAPPRPSGIGDQVKVLVQRFLHWD
jgi:tetratricopeptide (TPR) repeat protein